MRANWFFLIVLLGISGLPGALAVAQTAPVSTTTAPAPAPSATTSPASPATPAATQGTSAPASGTPGQIPVNGGPAPEKSISELQAQFSSTCLFCPLVGRIFASAMVLGGRVFAAMAPEAARFLVVALGIWLLWQAGKLLFPFAPLERGSVTGNSVLLRVLFGVAASAILLVPGGYRIYWDYVYMPVVDGAVNLGDALLNSGIKEGTLLWELKKQNLDRYTPTRITSLTTEQAAMKDKLELQIYALQNAFTYGLAIGVYLFQSGAYLTGLFLMVAYVAAPLMFVMVIISAVLHWTFLSVLSPALIGAAVFPKTRGYTIAAIKQMMGSALSLITASIVAVISAGMVMFSIQSAYNQMDNEASWGNLPDWLRAMVVQDPYSRSNAVPVNGSAATPAGAQLLQSNPAYQDVLKAGLMPLPYRDTPLNGTTDVTRGALDSGGFMWPANGTLTSGYGPRWGRNHNGIDIAAPTGTPIVASDSGTVIFAGYGHNEGFGNLVEIRHPNGYVTKYAHNSKLHVRNGQSVQKGQRIADMGSTGYSTGPHLHFEIHKPGAGPVDPKPYLDGSQKPDASAVGMMADGSGPLSGYADFAAPLDLSHKATWQLILAALIPMILVRSVPQAFNSILALPATPGGNAFGGVVGGVLKSGTGVALTGIASVGNALRGIGSQQPPDRSDQGADGSASGASASDPGSTNRDPQLASSYSDSAARQQMQLPSAGMRDGEDARTQTIDVEAVRVPDDGVGSIIPTQKMTAPADTVKEGADSGADATGSKESDKRYTLLSKLFVFLQKFSYYSGSAILGLAGVVAAVGRAFGVDVTYDENVTIPRAQKNTDSPAAAPDAAAADTEKGKGNTRSSGNPIKALMGREVNLGSASSSERSSGDSATRSEEGAAEGPAGGDGADNDRQDATERDAATPRDDGGGQKRVAAKGWNRSDADTAAPDGRARENDPGLEGLRRFVEGQQQNLGALIKAAAANDPTGKHAALLAQAQSLAGVTLSNRDAGDLASLLGAMKNLEAPLNSASGNRKPTSPGGGGRR